MELLYFANPWCSWCWGFAPTLEAVTANHPDIRLTVALGRLDINPSKPLSSKVRASIAEHWSHVHEMTGQPFAFETLERPDLTYDTTQACQALMLVRQNYPALAHAFLVRLGERYFRLGHDLTRVDLLSEAAAEFGLPKAAVQEALSSGTLQETMLAEWSQTERLGVGGYPTLLLLGQGKPRVLTIGWADTPQIEQALAAVH